MTNPFVISSMARLLAKTSENIEMMVNSTAEANNQDPALSEVYADMILDELNHAQVMVLELTKMMTGATEPGDLSVTGETGDIPVATLQGTTVEGGAE